VARDTTEPIAFIRKQLEDVEPDVLRALLHDARPIAGGARG